jgi:hypothetical protein
MANHKPPQARPPVDVALPKAEAVKAELQPPPAAAETCSTCSFGTSSKAMTRGAGHALNAREVIVCRRYPEPLQKMPTEWCGEHPKRRR